MGCAMHKGTRWSEGPLAAKRFFFLNRKGFNWPATEALHQGPDKPCYVTVTTYFTVHKVGLKIMLINTSLHPRTYLPVLSLCLFLVYQFVYAKH